jgi:hypothetical protein
VPETKLIDSLLTGRNAAFCWRAGTGKDGCHLLADGFEYAHCLSNPGRCG